MPEHPRAVIVVIHGGAWWGANPVYVKSMRPYARQLRRLTRAATSIVDYHTGERSLRDVDIAYRRARARFPRLPICLAGLSAGANLALLEAYRRPLDCVIAEAPPTDIETGSSEIKTVADFLFGRERYRAWSPALSPRRLRAPTLLVHARNDPIVPLTQGIEFKQRHPRAKLVMLPDGGAWFAHSKVRARSLRAARRAEADMILRAGRRRSGA